MTSADQVVNFIDITLAIKDDNAFAGVILKKRGDIG